MSERPPHTPVQPVDAVKALIRDDLRAAMRARNAQEASVLRTILAALDNAEAVPVTPGRMPYVARPFGDRAVEVPRKTLMKDDIKVVLDADVTERLTAARDLEQHGKTAEANGLEAEAAIVARYLHAIAAT